MEVKDTYTNTNVFVPPSGHAAMVMARTDNTSYPWWAPFGLTVGYLSDVLRVRTITTQGNRDYMYGNGNAINCIAKPFSNSSYVVWGERTLQRASTSRDRIHVRRMLNYLGRALTYASRRIIGSPNDEITWANFRDLAEPICEFIKNTQGLEDFRVVCNSSTNPVEARRNSQMRAQIVLVPMNFVETLVLNFVLLPVGATVTEVGAY